MIGCVVLNYNDAKTTVEFVQRVKNITQTNQGTTNIALLMALNLYIDFVYVFIRIVNLIGNSKK